jgi:hypothetical protein
MTLHLSVIFHNSPPGKGLKDEEKQKFSAYDLEIELFARKPPQLR